MKRTPLLLMILILCSFIKLNNSLTAEGLKGKVASVTDYLYGTGKNDTVLYAKSASTYDAMGNEAYRKQYAARTSQDLPMIKWSYRYNNDSNKIQEEMYNGDGSLNGSISFTYDPEYNVLRTKRYGHDGGLLENCMYEYNSRGYKTACACFGAMGGLNGRWTYSYDGHNNLCVDQQDGGPVKSMKYDHGDLVEVKISKPDVVGGDTTVTRYLNIKKDKTGNWIKRTEITLHNGVHDTMVHKREITYY